MTRSKKPLAVKPARRRFTDEFKEEAVQMLLDGHSAASVAERLGLSSLAIKPIDTGRQQSDRPCAGDFFGYSIDIR